VTVGLFNSAVAVTVAMVTGSDRKPQPRLNFVRLWVCRVGRHDSGIRSSKATRAETNRASLLYSTYNGLAM
jgi:hypothetical protein